ncbi:TetR/AcrR family transcriptional regulator [Streptomyces litchfieldiae]|uniref:TetR/AcrR family transcriptional regulator n=1 Tax=Streptomyces litchfieldiae TaxID=3075543 RepID=A0ABU2MQ43_9ACTN|nr:TetR/AcrR family transcriptional regulator [Streptomyces sp. DSM 44938]MDT0343214.1 TetR/AcrR family transcriptional regulator [Streptomyces sp. DSM 44938]
MTTAHSGSGDISRSLELMWQGRERPSRGPKPGLTLERIVAAAVDLADREGLAALSMRKVAAELGVGTMSLYRYVPGKGELLDLMLDHVIAPGPDLEEHRGKDWRTTMRVVAEGTYSLYLDHPWLLQVNQSRPLLGPNALLGFDFALAALEGLDLTGQEKIGVIMAVDSYTTGIARHYVLLRQANEESGLTDEEFWAAQAPLMETALASGCYPHVFALPDDTFSATPEEMVEFGLARVLDGIEAFIEAKSRPNASG